METTYFDCAGQHFSHLHWTLRHRMEADRSVICLKTPSPLPHVRNEWETEAAAPDRAAMEALLRQGAPEELLSYVSAGPLTPICGARFLRRCGMLHFPDGSRAEIAGDFGILFGAKGTLPIRELELELYEGEGEFMQRFAAILCRQFHLSGQPMSKFARAKTLV